MGVPGAAGGHFVEATTGRGVIVTAVAVSRGQSVAAKYLPEYFPSRGRFGHSQALAASESGRAGEL